MTTPLSLKSFEICNRVYKNILHHKSFASLNTYTKQFEVIPTNGGLLYYYIYTFALIYITICSADIIYEMRVSQTLPYSLPYLSINLFLLALISSAIVLLIIFISNRHLLYIQYLNTLLKYEQIILPTKTRNSTQESLLMLLKQGIFLIFNLIFST